MTILGTTNDDNLDGTAGNDEFDMSQGGDDIVRGLDGADQFLYAGTFDAHDHVFGGAGVDALLLSGAYDVTFGSKTIRGIEQLYLDDGFDYRFVLQDGNVAAGQTLVVNASLLTGTHKLVLNAINETDGKFLVLGGAGDDAIGTGAGNDNISTGDGDDIVQPGSGKDIVVTGAGEDLIVFGEGELDPNDSVDGVDRLDHVVISGDYSAGLTFRPDTLKNLSFIDLDGGHSYTFHAAKFHPYDGFSVIVNGANLGAADVLAFDAGGNAGGAFTFHGGAGADQLTGGTGYDTFFGNGGADRLTGGGGPDTYFYTLVSDSIGKAYDTIVGFDAQVNFIFPQFPGDGDAEHVTAVDARVNGGTLSMANFNADLAAAIGHGELGHAHAVLFAPDAGGLAGELFLIVDANGQAGYQGGQDLVIHFESAKHMGAFDLHNFSTAG
jgi:Ca2+-binding RTX toxin-like protein